MGIGDGVQKVPWTCRRVSALLIERRLLIDVQTSVM
jgi:hypothetical protein